MNTTTIATRQHERKLWHDHRHVSYRQLFWVQEALGFDPNCFPTFEHHKVFLATVLRKPWIGPSRPLRAAVASGEKFGETGEVELAGRANPPLFLASRMGRQSRRARPFTARCPQNMTTSWTRDVSAGLPRAAGPRHVE